MTKNKPLATYLKSLCDSNPRYKKLDTVVLAIANGAINIQHLVRLANLAGVVGSSGDINVQGEIVQILDTRASDTFVQTMTSCAHVAAIGCEEIERLVQVGINSKNSYIVHMDPLDGSSNIDVAISIGSIFGIWPGKTNVNKPQEITALLPGNQQIAAAYALYGSSTVLVLATENSVQGFTLNPDTNIFELTHTDIQLPKKCNYYSVNEGNYQRFDSGTQRAVSQLRDRFSLRYIGSLVADFHRNLLKGGIFLYPQDSTHAQGKLRLMYEANPLSFIIEQAGGTASSGTRRILDIQPDSLHQRTPLIIGNTMAVNDTVTVLGERLAHS